MSSFHLLKQTFNLSLHGRRVIQTFLVKRPGKRSYSAVSLGKHFEKMAVAALTRHSFDVYVCGGPKDKGVDFRGKWRLKDLCVPVVGQCRKYKKRLGPRHVREMEGVLGRESEDTLGILVSSQGYTKDAYDACMGSSRCFALTVLKGFVENDLQMGDIESSNTEKGRTAHGCELAELYAVQKEEVLASDCSVHTTREPQFLHKYQTCLESVGESNDEVKSCKDNIRETQWKQTQSKLGNVVSDNHSSNGLLLSNSGCVSDEFERSTDYSDCAARDYMKESLIDQRMSGVDDEANERNTFLTSGQITLFELNPAARKLLPHVVVGTTYKGKHARTPEIMFVEDDSILHVKSE